jgi:Family of unknown function (DUF6444)
MMTAMPDTKQPSYDERAAMVVELQDAPAAAHVRIAGLEARLKQSPKNSSKPPSSDPPFVKPAPKSLRGRSGRAVGGQDGHVIRELVAVFDSLSQDEGCRARQARDAAPPPAAHTCMTS